MLIITNSDNKIIDIDENVEVKENYYFFNNSLTIYPKNECFTLYEVENIPEEILLFDYYDGEKFYKEV